jgi:hypothetical protein
MDRSRDPAASHRLFWQAYCVFATVHVLLCGYQACWNSPTRNEIAHLVAGVSHLTFQRFDLYRVNPPLVRSAAAVPVVLASPETGWEAYRFEPTERRENQVGGRFAELNGQRSFFLMTLARCACIPFSLLGSWICGRWAMRLYGLPSAILAMTLWFCSPMLLGHASLITPDAHAAAWGVCGMYCIWNWLSLPSWKSALWAGLVLGLAEVTKFTLLVLYPVIISLWAVYWLRAPIEGKPGQRRAANERPPLHQLVALLALSVLTINLGYGFEGTFKTLGDYRFQSTLFTGDAREHPSPFPPGRKNRFADTVVDSLPIPLPANYVQGIDTQRMDFEQGVGPSYLCGRWRERGWWYWYLCASLFKTPLGTIALLALAVMLTVFRRWANAPWRDELTVLLPPIAVFALVSSQTGFTIHYRYVLPALPFLFIWASKVARVFELRPCTGKRFGLAAMVAVALAWSVTSSLWAYPHSLSYFNELVGGPRHGGEHLLDSNMDWGQDLLYLKRWLDRHPEVKLDGLAYWGSCPVTLAGIPDTPHPPAGSGRDPHTSSSTDDQRGPTPGWHAVSVNGIFDRSGRYRYFRGFQPVAMAGYSICVYHVTLDEANRVRKELGLPELPEDRLPREETDPAG